MTYLEYTNLEKNIIYKIIDYFRITLDTITENYIGRTLIFIGMISILFIIIYKFIKISYLETEKDKETMILNKSYRIERIRVIDKKRNINNEFSKNGNKIKEYIKYNERTGEIEE